jgi:hypothetical protein
VKHADQARPQVLDAAVRVEQGLVTGERMRHRVDREVAAAEVLGDSRRAHLGQRPRLRVGLGAGAGDVDLGVADHDDGRPEALVLGRRPSQRRDQGLDLAFDDDVEVEVRSADQPVADAAADDVRGHPLSRLADGLVGGVGAELIG